MKFVVCSSLLALFGEAAQLQRNGSNVTEVKAPGNGTKLLGEAVQLQKRESPVTKVVGMLKDMLDKSKADGEAQAEAYDEFKCYCDDNMKDKREAIAENTKDSRLLTAKIEELQGRNGELSIEVSRLHSAIAENEQQRDEAQSIRDKAHEGFKEEETDLVNAVDQMKDAIKMLAEVGADQTLDSGEDHEKMMAGFESLLGKKMDTILAKRVQSSLVAAGAFLTPAQKTKVTTFLQHQAPGGNYASQSGQVVGILKNMQGTFESNLEQARSSEKRAAEAHPKFMETLTDKYDKMKGSYDEKSENMGSNDGTLSDKKDQLRTAKDTVSDAEEFLSKLVPLCASKEKTYDTRKQLRASEEAAVAKAVAILEHDADSFADSADQKNALIQNSEQKGKTMLLQLPSTTSKSAEWAAKMAQIHAKDAVQVLSKVQRTKPLAALIKSSGNAFEKVLKGIGKMLVVIEHEGKVDKERKEWCETEREQRGEDLEAKTDEVTNLEADIEGLDDLVDNVETGLKVQIKQAEEDLENCVSNMKEETASRREENTVYQEDISTMVNGQEALQKAIDVLHKFYKSLESDDDDALVQFVRTGKQALVQFSKNGKHSANTRHGHKEDPDAPEVMEDEFEGQSGAGSEVLELLKTIFDNSRDQEARCHQDEEQAQHDYEDSMTDLKTEEHDLKRSIVKLDKDLADSKQNLDKKHHELTKTEKSKLRLEQYIEKIKPGCDFVVDNFESREESRASEKAALEKAQELLQESPKFKQAMQKAKDAALGDCKGKCVEQGEDHAACKACLAKVSVPGYCAGHSDTPGC